MSNAREPAPAAGHDDALASASAPFAGLIALGLSRGFVTRGDVIDALPDDDAHDAGIDAATAVLAELGIAVSDDAHAETDWSLDRHFRPPPLSRAAAESNSAFAAFDLLATRRLHRATGAGLLVYVLMIALIFLLPAIPLWQQFTAWVAR